MGRQGFSVFLRCMGFLLCILALFLALLLFLLFTTITLKIDSYQQQYYVQVWGLCRASIVTGDAPILEFRVLFLRFRIDLLEQVSKGIARRKQRQEAATSSPERKDRRMPKRMGQRLWRVLRSFKVRQLELDLDTGSVQWNAYLWPLFYFLRFRHALRHLHINYNGRVEAALHIENRLARMLWAFIRS